MSGGASPASAGAAAAADGEGDDASTAASDNQLYGVLEALLDLRYIRYRKISIELHIRVVIFQKKKKSCLLFFTSRSCGF